MDSSRRTPAALPRSEREIAPEPGRTRLMGQRPWGLRGVLLYVAAIVAATVVGLVRFALSDSARTYHVDFDVYRAGGEAVLNGIPLYEGRFHVYGIDLPFTYPPLSALLFIPLAILPNLAGFLTLTLLSLIITVLTTAVVIAELTGTGSARIPRRRVIALSLLVLPVAIWLWPLTHTLEFGQVNIILMGLVVADLLLPKTPWPRGTLIGFAAALKLTPAVFVLYFVIKRQWKDAIVSVASGVAFAAGAWLILPTDSHRYWFHTLSDPTRIGDLGYAANQSLRGTIARFTDDPTQTRVWMILSVVVAVGIIVTMIRQIAVGATVAAMCTNSLFALLISPVSWAHHWVWVLPMLLVTGTTWWKYRRIGSLILCTVILVISTAFPVHLYLHSGHGVETDWTLWMKILAPSFVWAGLVWIITTAVFPGLVNTVSRSSSSSTVPSQP